MTAFGGTGGLKSVFLNNHFVFDAGLNLGKRFTYENGELIKGTTPINKFFYVWDISLRLLVGYRF
jgi:hypothetical protein